MQAQFNPLIRPYLVLYAGLVMLMTIVFAPLALLWFCGVIIDAHDFRNHILRGREALNRSAQGGAAGAPSAADVQTELLRSIRSRLDEIVELLRSKST